MVTLVEFQVQMPQVPPPEGLPAEPPLWCAYQRSIRPPMVPLRMMPLPLWLLV